MVRLRPLRYHVSHLLIVIIIQRVWIEFTGVALPWMPVMRLKVKLETEAW